MQAFYRAKDIFSPSHHYDSPDSFPVVPLKVDGTSGSLTFQGSCHGLGFCGCPGNLADSCVEHRCGSDGLWAAFSGPLACPALFLELSNPLSIRTSARVPQCVHHHTQTCSNSQTSFTVLSVALN